MIKPLGFSIANFLSVCINILCSFQSLYVFASVTLFFLFHCQHSSDLYISTLFVFHHLFIIPFQISLCLFIVMFHCVCSLSTISCLYLVNFFAICSVLTFFMSELCQHFWGFHAKFSFFCTLSNLYLNISIFFMFVQCHITGVCTLSSFFLYVVHLLYVFALLFPETGLRYWTADASSLSENSKPYWYRVRPSAISVETTGYALLAQLALGDVTYSHSIVKWLSKQQNYGGGFASTQVDYSSRL